MRTRLDLIFAVFAAIVTPARADDHMSIGGSALGTPRAVTVHVPPEYGNNSLRFPVLYVLDADVQMAHVVSSAEFLARVGRIPPLIIVGVASKDNRVRDYTPTRGALVGAGGRVSFPESGGATAFAEVLRKELVPLVDKNYRTQPFRILAGHSLGGLFALYASTEVQSPFDAVIAASPTLTWDDDYVERALAAFFKRPERVQRDLVVTMGAEEAPNVAAFHRLRGVLTASAPAGIRWSAEFSEREDHNSTPLVTFYEGLRFVFGGWRAPVATFRDLAELEQHYQKLSEKLHYTIQPPEQTLNAFGYRQLANGSIPEALLAFRRNIELYPASANVYDSLGDALERSKEHLAARAAYAKAVEIAQRNNDSNLAAFAANLRRVEALLRAVK